MWKTRTNNRTLPTRLPLIERHQKETQYPRWYKDATGKELWNEESNEVPQENRDVWGNINLMDDWWDQYTDSSIL